MLIRKTIATITFTCFALLLSALVISCSGGSDKSSTGSDSAAMKTAPASDSSTTANDTTKLDTASTRPVKSPN